MISEAVPNLKLVAYERVSTARQGRSGLGLEAQRRAIDAFAASRKAVVLARFTEVESGKRNDRPELDKALQLAKLTGATLVIAKLDRLSRNAAFLLTLQASGVRFLAVDMPEANDLTVGIMALVAQQEREAISRRTKEALAAAKARGVKLGKLQALRDRLGKPLIVRSAYRSPEHNRAVGGATRSKHLDGAAFDIAMANHDPAAFEAAAREVGFLGFGFYPRSGFMDVDLGPARQWGERFLVRATAFASETPPAREVLADSRTMKG